MKIKLCLKGKGLSETFEEVTSATFFALEEAFTSEPALIGVSAKEIGFSFDHGTAVVAVDPENGNCPVGFTRLQPLLTHLHPLGAWFELGTTWVHEQYRHRGLNERMYELLLPAHAGENILATTTNPISFQTGKRFGFVHIRRKDLPEPVWSSTCFCPQKKTGASVIGDNSDCRLAWGEPQHAEDLHSCWLRVTKETAERHNLSSQ